MNTTTKKASVSVLSLIENYQALEKRTLAKIHALLRNEKVLAAIANDALPILRNQNFVLLDTQQIVTSLEAYRDLVPLVIMQDDPQIRNQQTEIAIRVLAHIDLSKYEVKEWNVLVIDGVVRKVCKKQPTLIEFNAPELMDHQNYRAIYYVWCQCGEKGATSISGVSDGFYDFDNEIKELAISGIPS